MKKRVESFMVPFPRGMLSTVRAPLTMPPTFARNLKNMYVRADGSGSKRNGFSAIGAALTGETIAALFSYVTRAGVRQRLAVCASGSVYVLENEVWRTVFSGLSDEGVFRGAFFDDKLILCNGVDDVLLWDGDTLAPIVQWIADPSSGLTRVDNDTFTIESSVELYAVGAEVRCVDSDGNSFLSTVASVTTSGETLIVNLADAVVPLGLVAVEYAAKPPKFREIYAAHDRLWGMGDTPLSAEFGDSENRMRVFYTAGVNNPTAWHDADGFLQSINLTDKTNTADELLSMRVVDGLTLFFGRENIQVWGGYDPSITGDFEWRQTLPLGAVHPGLIVDMPNDVAFVSKTGVRTISRALQTEELTVGDVGREVDTQFSGHVMALLKDADLYRKATSFVVPEQGWFGFFMNRESLIFQVNGSGQGWSVFDGFFADADAFLQGTGGLEIARGSQVFDYDMTTFSDDDAAIMVEWFTPWISPARGFKRFAVQGFQVLTEQEASLELKIERFREYDTSRAVLSTTASNVAADFWDASDWEESYFDNGRPDIQVVRDNFVSSVLAYRLRENSKRGPLTIFGLQVYGVRER